MGNLGMGYRSESSRESLNWPRDGSWIADIPMAALAGSWEINASAMRWLETASTEGPGGIEQPQLAIECTYELLILTLFN